MPTCFLNIINYNTRCKHFSAQITLWNTSLIVPDYVLILFSINKNMRTHLHRQGMYELVCFLWNLLTLRKFKSLTHIVLLLGEAEQRSDEGSRREKKYSQNGHCRWAQLVWRCIFALDSSKISLFVWTEYLCCLNTGTLSQLLVYDISFPFVRGTSLSFCWKQVRDFWQVRWD